MAYDVYQDAFDWRRQAEPGAAWLQANLDTKEHKR
jgi:hypothetical protein